MPDQPKFPSWVRAAHTQQLINTLNSATYVELPSGVSNEDDAKKLLTMLDQAGLEFRCHVPYYEGYIPVVVMIPSQRRADSPALPAHLKVGLSEADKAEAEKLRQKFGVDPAGAQPDWAYNKNATRLEWELAKTVAGRLNDYYGLVKDGIPTPGKAAGTLALGFVSTNLGFASSYLEDPDSPLGQVMVNCLAFGINVASLSSTPAIPALGIIGAISVLESLVSCARPIEQALGNLRRNLQELARLKAMLDAIPRERQGDHFDRNGGRVEVRERDHTVDAFRASNPRLDVVTVTERPAGKPDGKCEFVRDSDKESCKFSEQKADGTERRVREIERNTNTGEVDVISGPPN